MIYLILVAYSIQIQCLCIKQISKPIQSQSTTLEIWLTYQRQIELCKIKIQNESFMTLNTEINHTIYFSFVDYYFLFYSKELEFKLNSILQPGQYMRIELHTILNQTLKFVYDQTQIKFHICFAEDHTLNSIIENVLQSQYLYSQYLRDIDNSNLLIKLWIKQIYQSNGLTQIELFSDFGQFFQYNFKEKYMKLGQYDRLKYQSFQLVYNCWFYFEFQTFVLNDNQFKIRTLIKSYQQEERKQFEFSGNYSFENSIRFIHQNSIFTQFTIIQNAQNVSENSICEPDCETCLEGKCSFCKNNNKLESSCICRENNMISDENGICKYPAEFLILQEYLNDQQCKEFGYHYDHGINECIPCFNDQGLPDIYCLYHKYEDVTFNPKDYMIFKVLVETWRFKCQKGCKECIIKSKKVICLLCDDGFFLMNGMCSKCEIHHCAFCITASTGKITCSLCDQFYTLVNINQCIYSKAYQFTHIKQLLSNEFQYGQVQDQCEISNNQICIYCAENYYFVNDQCQPFNYTVLEFYNSSSFYAQKPYQYFQIQRSTTIMQTIALLNLRKIYYEKTIKDTIYFSQQASMVKFQPSYYNKDIRNLKMLSFCSKYENCKNFIALNISIVPDQQNLISLSFENQLYNNLYDILLYLENYDVYFYHIDVYITSSIEEFSGQSLFKILKTKELNVQLFVKLNSTLLIDSNITIKKLRSLNLDGVTLKSSIQYTIKIFSKFIHFNMVIIRGPISFALLQQESITINKIYYESPDQRMGSYLFLCLESTDVKITIQNSNFSNFELYNSVLFYLFETKVQISITNCMFSSISLKQSQLIENANLTSTITINLREMQFINVSLINSNIMILEQEILEFQINRVLIQFISFDLCKLNNSTIFFSDDGAYEIYKINNILIQNSEFIDSKLFILNIRTLDQFLFQDVYIFNTYLQTKLFISLNNYGASYFINIQFIDLMGQIQQNGCLTNIIGINLTIQNYSIINQNSEQFYLGNHFYIFCKQLLIKDYSIISQFELILEVQNDLQIEVAGSCILENIKYDQIIFTGQNFLNFLMSSSDGITIKNLFIEMTLDCIRNKNQMSIQQNIIKIITSESTFNALDLVCIIDFTGDIHQLNNIIVSQSLDINIQKGYFQILGASEQKQSLLSIEGQNVKLQDIQFIFDMNRQWSSKMLSNNSFICNLVDITGTTVYLQNFLFKTNHLMTNFIKLGSQTQQSQAIINNIKVQQMSQFNILLLVTDSNFNFLDISNIWMQSNSSKRIIDIIQISQNSRVIIKNVQIKQKFNSDFKLISIQNGYTVSLRNILYFSFHGVNNQSIINIQAKFLSIQYLFLKNLTSQGMIIYSDFLLFQFILIKESQSSNDLISINQQNILENNSKLIIYNIIISNNKLRDKSSLIIINYTRIIQFLITEVIFLKNFLDNGQIITIEINQLKADINSSNSQTNLSELQKQIKFQNLFTLDNKCLVCFRLFNNQEQNLKIKINQNQYLNNTVDIIIKSKGFDLILIKNDFSNFMMNQDSEIIQSDRDILLFDSFIILNQGVFHYKKGQQNIILNNSLIQILESNQQHLIDSQQIIPSSLKISINDKKSYLMCKLLQSTQNKKQQKLLFKENNISDEYLYFPSGRELNNYKILKLDQRQYLGYVDYIYIYGYNENNNIELQINKCELSTDNGNITMMPNYINSTLLLSNVLFIGDPYIIDYFTLQINCQYEEVELQLLVNSKLFKCQLGEILNNNQCQQCKIEQNLYSVKKHSQVCKLVDYDKIEVVKIGLLKLKQGYWRPKYSNDEIEHCESNNCLGGWDVDYNSCVQGYTGPLCRECDYNNIRGDGHYSKYRQQCYECQYEVNYIFNILYIVIVSQITLTITTRSQYLICQRYQILICQNKYYQILNKLSIDQISVLIKQIQNYFFYLQFVNIILEIDLSLGLFINAVSNPIQILNPQYDCIISQLNLNQQITKMIMQIITPICILVVFYSIIIVINRYVKFRYFYVFIYTPILQIFIVYQIVICQSAISHLTYIKISGIKWIYGARQLQYFESNNISLFIGLLLVIIIFAVFIPSIFLLVLKLRQNRLYNKIIITKIGYLYQEFKSSVYFWEFFKMSSKLVFITFSLLCINEIKVLVSINTFYIFILLQCIILKMPYYLKNLNNFDAQIHLLFLTSFIFMGIINNNQQESIKTIFILLLYISNGLYFIFIIKFIWLKLYYSNPILVDKLQQKLNRTNQKSLVQAKMDSISKFQSAKKQLRSSSVRKSILLTDNSQTVNLKNQSNAIQNNYIEIELVSNIQW